MRANKTKQATAMPKVRRSQAQHKDKRESKLLEARREQLRSSSVPSVKTSSEVTKMERPRSAEDKVDASEEKVKFKTLLHCMLAGEWTSAMGRISNLEGKSPELNQSNVTICIALFPFEFRSNLNYEYNFKVKDLSIISLHFVCDNEKYNVQLEILSSLLMHSHSSLFVIHCITSLQDCSILWFNSFSSKLKRRI